MFPPPLSNLSLSSISSVSQELQSCEEEGDDDVSEEAQNELSVLYHDRCYSQLVGMLSSAGLSARALAGVTYLLALLTAGNSDYAENFRSKVRGALSCVLCFKLPWLADSELGNVVLRGRLLKCPSVPADVERFWSSPFGGASIS